jgi:hypothetical protein
MDCRKIFYDCTDQIEMAGNNGQWWIMFCNNKEILVQWNREDYVHDDFESLFSMIVTTDD